MTQKKTTTTIQQQSHHHHQQTDPWSNDSDKLQLAMSKVVSIDDELDSDEDMIDLGHNNSKPHMAKKGVIDQGIGTFIGSSNLTQSPLTSPLGSPVKYQQTSTKSSFIDLVPEMFNSSPRRMKSDEREDERLTNELLQKLKEKNAALETSKFELEEQLRKTEMEKKRFEISFKNLDKLLAEKEQLISKMNDEKYSIRT